MDNFHVLALVVFITLIFEFTNGWHDAASSIATVVSTRVLRPLWAVAWAALWNFVAAFVFGTAVAKTMGIGLVNLGFVNEYVILAGLLGAIVWNYATIPVGIPCSSSHALMGGYGGAAIAAAGFRAITISGWIMPIIFIFVAPIIGFAAGAFTAIVTSWIVRRKRIPECGSVVPAASAGVGGGVQLRPRNQRRAKRDGDYYRGSGDRRVLPTYVVPYWVIICCHLALAGGTMAGGWRVVKTMGQRITKLKPFAGFAAETSAALTLIGTAHAGIPVSSTHVITGAITGVGSSRRLTAVRWGVTRRIVWAWIFTIPGAGLVGASFYHFMLHFSGASR